RGAVARETPARRQWAGHAGAGAALRRAAAVRSAGSGRTDDEGQPGARAAVRARAAPPRARADRAPDAALARAGAHRGAEQREPQGLRLDWRRPADGELVTMKTKQGRPA